MKLLQRLGVAPCRETRTRRAKPAFVPSVSGLEQRVQMSTLTVSAVVASSTAAVPAINQKVLSFLASNVGKRVGGGECAQMVTEALRVSGAKFANIGADSPAPGDYVWGTFVKSVQVVNGRWSDSSPTTAVQPGDVIQYSNATFSNGSSATHHTSVVATVNAKGQPTSVYEQNVFLPGATAASRVVHLDAIDLTKLTGGYVRIYQPAARVATAGLYQITVVNNTAVAQTFTPYYGTTAGGPIALTAANTTASYLTLWFNSSVQPTLKVNGTSVPVVNGAGYQIVTSGGSTTIVRLSA